MTEIGGEMMRIGILSCEGVLSGISPGVEMTEMVGETTKCRWANDGDLPARAFMLYPCFIHTLSMLYP